MSRKVYQWLIVLVLASALALSACEGQGGNGDPAGLGDPGSSEQVFDGEPGDPDEADDAEQDLPDTGGERDGDEDGDIGPLEDEDEDVEENSRDED